jgi:hypothetical protein
VPTKKKKTYKPEDLDPQEGKVLRFFVSRLDREKQTPTDDCIVETVWSNLPKNHLEAIQVTGKLRRKGLLVTGEKGFCVATQAGASLIKAANEGNFWQQAPPPTVTNPKMRA